MGNEETSDLNLKQVAAELGVHYMTAYRYIRRADSRLDGWARGGPSAGPA